MTTTTTVTATRPDHDGTNAVIHALYLNGFNAATAIPQPLTEQLKSTKPHWLHLDMNAPDSRRWLERSSGLSDIAVEGLLAAETRPRVVSRGDNLLLIVRGVNTNPGCDMDDMVSARIWTDGTRVISTQLRSLRSTNEVAVALESGEGPNSIIELLIYWLTRIVERVDDALDGLEDDVLTLEERALSGERSNLRADFARVRRQCITLRRYLAPQREALTRLASEPVSWLDDTSRLRLREIADRQVRHVEALDEIRERAAVAHEELVSQISEEMNERVYVLSIAAALFLPLGFFTGLMGINVGGMPGIDNPMGFWTVAGVCLLALLCLLIAFRVKRWM